MSFQKLELIKFYNFKQILYYIISYCTILYYIIHIFNNKNSIYDSFAPLFFLGCI